jgi:hypothetical protein
MKNKFKVHKNAKIMSKMRREPQTFCSDAMMKGKIENW